MTDYSQHKCKNCGVLLASHSDETLENCNKAWQRKCDVAALERRRQERRRNLMANLAVVHPSGTCECGHPLEDHQQLLNGGRGQCNSMTWSPYPSHAWTCECVLYRPRSVKG